VPIVVAVQAIDYKGVCPYPAHLFIDVLAKVGYVKNATSIVQVRINQVSPELSSTDSGDLSFVHVHDRPHCEQRFAQQYAISSTYMKLCNFEHWGQKVFTTETLSAS
jgi:hypothetical protein